MGRGWLPQFTRPRSSPQGSIWKVGAAAMPLACYSPSLRPGLKYPTCGVRTSPGPVTSHSA